ncbi:MAG: hypothetical protein ABI760_04600 [Ferruginibacter sp.]
MNKRHDIKINVASNAKKSKKNPLSMKITLAAGSNIIHADCRLGLSSF